MGGVEKERRGLGQNENAPSGSSSVVRWDAEKRIVSGEVEEGGGVSGR